MSHTRLGTPTRAAWLLAAALTAAGCASPESRYYLIPDSPLPADGAAVPARAPTVFVDEATVAAYLDRPELATRVGGSRVEFAEFDVWAEPLAPLVTRAVVDDLGRRFDPDRVLVTPPRLDFDPDYLVTLHVLRLDADETGDVVLDARWTLLPAQADRPALTGREVITAQAPVSAAEDPVGPYDARVAAMGETLRTLAGRIAAAIDDSRIAARP